MSAPATEFELADPKRLHCPSSRRQREIEHARGYLAHPNSREAFYQAANYADEIEQHANLDSASAEKFSTTPTKYTSPKEIEEDHDALTSLILGKYDVPNQQVREQFAAAMENPTCC